MNIVKDLPHERCNYINDNIIIGACPNEQTLPILEEFGIEIFIDLREQTNYQTSKEKYHFPMLGGKSPSKKQIQLIFDIVFANTNKLIYIHCSGGHGRAGTVGAYILGKLYNLDSKDAITRIEKARENRIDKSKNFIPTPETTCQVLFLQSHLGLNSTHSLPDRKNMSWLKRAKEMKDIIDT